MKIFNELNDKQKEVVKYNKGPQLVLAGAGSGKTKTLITKILYLVEKEGYKPQDIMAVTFSNKAAMEMKNRIAKNFKGEGWFNISTFHAFCAKFLRTELPLTGSFNKRFTIFDEADTKSVAKEVLTNEGYDLKEFPPQALLSYVEKVKNEGFYLKREKELDKKVFDPDIHPLFELYEKELEKSNAVDFGGLITQTLKILETDSSILKKYHTFFKYFLVDEYQDTNTAQFDLIYILSKHNNKICVVGDEDQCIYSWRGSKIGNILSFDKHFKDGKIFKLEQNYRSSKKIIEAASAVVRNNSFRIGKELWTDNKEGKPISLIDCPSDIEESLFISNEVQRLISSGVDPKEIAIFYRKNAQSRSLEDKLRSQNIHYKIVGGIKFYDRKEIKDLLAYLKASLNPRDSISVERVLNTPTRGIGKKTIENIKNYCFKEGLSLWEGLNSQDKIKVSKKAGEGIDNFISIINGIQDLIKNNFSAYDCYQYALDHSEYIEMLEKNNTHQDNGKIENLEEFKSVFLEFQKTAQNPTLENFMETITLDKSENFEDEGFEEITLMTVHASKGLEFEYVFIAGAEENIFPAEKSLSEGLHQLEEERRLFYVAMTRAKKKLYICYTRTRFLYGFYSSNPMSRFVKEIPREYILEFRI